MSDDNHERLESENDGNREDLGYRPPPPPPNEGREYKGYRVPKPPAIDKGEIDKPVESDQSE